MDLRQPFDRLLILHLSRSLSLGSRQQDLETIEVRPRRTFLVLLGHTRRLAWRHVGSPRNQRGPGGESLLCRGLQRPSAEVPRQKRCESGLLGWPAGSRGVERLEQEISRL